MKRKNVYVAFGILCIAASITMYMIGKNSSHMEELNDFWWMPLPLGAISLLLATKTK